jgi:uncharacterized RDD family membrane protein YckC
MQDNKTTETLEYAGFFCRAAAFILDHIIVAIPLMFIRFVIWVAEISIGTNANGTGILFNYTWKDIFFYLIQVLYFILFTYYTGTTPGKRAMNLIVTDDKGEKLTFLNVVYRETIGRFLCGLSIGIGYLFAGVDSKKRGLHDMLCDSQVIYAKRIQVVPKYTGNPVPQMVSPNPYANVPNPFMGQGQPQPPVNSQINPAQQAPQAVENQAPEQSVPSQAAPGQTPPESAQRDINTGSATPTTPNIDPNGGISLGTDGKKYHFIN